VPQTSVQPKHQPFHFTRTAKVLVTSPHNRIEQWVEHTPNPPAVRRALLLSGQPTIVTAHAHAEGLSLSHDHPEAVRWARLGFGLDLDPSEFLVAANTDPVLAQAATALAGLRPPLMDAWEAWVAAILGQQVTLAFCYQQIAAIGKTLHGTIEDCVLHATPEQVLEADQEVLLGCKVSRRKGEYLKTAARALLDGYFTGIEQADLTTALSHLVALRGVGPWTARYWLLATGRLDALPYGDAGLNSAYRRAYAEHDPEGKHIEQWGEALGTGRGWAYYYLIWFIKYRDQLPTD
jgi:3-methyladenine DNA glycosylase/8-oxoguanine DNA glycosylase